MARNPAPRLHGHDTEIWTYKFTVLTSQVFRRSRSWAIDLTTGTFTRHYQHSSQRRAGPASSTIFRVLRRQSVTRALAMTEKSLAVWFGPETLSPGRNLASAMESGRVQNPKSF